MKDKNYAISTVFLGQNKTLFVPMQQDGKENSIAFFVKEKGKFEKAIYIEDLPQAIQDCIPLMVLNFKTKKSINELIKFLRFYRNNIYRKESRK